MTERVTTGLDIRINGPIWLVVACNIENVEPRDVLPWLVEPEKLRSWWGHEHEIEPRTGGAYVVRWPSIGKTLRGQIADIGETFVIFSWAFDEEPEIPAYVVAIHVSAHERGSTLELRHGPYRTNTSGVSERESHLAGWVSFLPQLRNAIAAARQ